MATGFGFKRHGADTSPQQLVTCVHLSGDSVLLGKGDAVKLVTGSIAVGNNGPIKQAIARAASGDKVYGVVTGCVQHTVTTGLTLDNTYCPASTLMEILVDVNKPGDLWDVQEDAVGGAVATTNIGNNATMIVANANTTTGMSGTMLDSSTAATTNTLDLCIRGFSDKGDNTPGSTAGAVLVVSFNKITQVDQATGV